MAGFPHRKKLMEAIRRTLAELFGHGPIHRDGVVVGSWHVLRRGQGGRRKVCRLWRAADGTMLGDTSEILQGEEDGYDGGTPEGFGAGLAKLMDCAGLAPAQAERPVSTDTQGAILSEVLRMHPGIDLWEADRIAKELVPEGLAGVAGCFAATLDPGAVSLLLRHPRHAEALGRHWRDVDGSTGDAPLALALAKHPGFPGQVAAIHRRHGADGMRRILADGSLGGLVAATLAAEGVPRIAIPLAGRAEAALAAFADAAAKDPGTCPKAVRWTLSDQGDHPWPVRLAMLLVGLPGTWAPRDTAGWRAFAMAAPVVGVLARTVDREALPGILNAGAGWDAFLHRLMTASGAMDTDGIVGAMERREDMASAYAADAIIPAAALAHPGGTSALAEAIYEAAADTDAIQRRAKSMLFGGRSLARVLELSTDWHRRQHRMREAVQAMPGAYLDTTRWVPGLPDATYGDVGVTVLRGARELTASASDGPDADGVPGLDNCASGYAAECRDGGTRILEIRGRRDGCVRRLSMVEVDVVDAPRLRVAQHVGHRNGPPPPEACRALDAYLADVATGRLPVDADAFEPVPDDGVDDIIRNCGFDPTVEATRLATARLWDRYLPGPWRGVDPADALRLPAPEGDGWGVRAPVPPGPEAPPPEP